MQKYWYVAAKGGTETRYSRTVNATLFGQREIEKALRTLIAKYTLSEDKVIDSRVILGHSPMVKIHSHEH